MKLFYRDSLSELRQAVYAVFKTAVFLHRQSSGYADQDGFLGRTIVSSMHSMKSNSRQLFMSGDERVLGQLHVSRYDNNSSEVLKKQQEGRRLASTNAGGDRVAASNKNRNLKKPVAPSDGKTITSLSIGAAATTNAGMSAAGAFKGTPAANSVNGGVGKPATGAGTKLVVTPGNKEKGGSAIPATDEDIKKVKNYQCIFPSQARRDDTRLSRRNRADRKSAQRRKPRVVIVTRNSSSPVDSAVRKLSRLSEEELRSLFVKRGAESAEICCDFSPSRFVSSVPAGEYSKKERNMQKTRAYADLFWDVDICVGIHGAGLTNCALGREGDAAYSNHICLHTV
jgi:hypothetical protein